jgi:hypothetical protein
LRVLVERSQGSGFLGDVIVRLSDGASLADDHEGDEDGVEHGQHLDHDGRARARALPRLLRHAAVHESFEAEDEQQAACDEHREEHGDRQRVEQVDERVHAPVCAR